MNIYLVGFRTSGKSQLGNALANHWQCSFVDMDSIFEDQYGSIIEYVEKNGMDAFRKWEERLLREVEQQGNSLKEAITVVATGGGVVDHPGSFSILLESNFPKVYLEVEPEELWRRLSAAPKERRIILNLNSYEQMSTILQRRRPLYEKIATLRVQNQDITRALKELDAKRARWCAEAQKKHFLSKG